MAESDKRSLFFKYRVVIDLTPAKSGLAYELIYDELSDEFFTRDS